MDLATGPRKVIIAMEHATKEGGAKILKRCTLPLTAAGKVSSIATKLAFFRFLDGVLTLVERAHGVTLEEIRSGPLNNGPAFLAAADHLQGPQLPSHVSPGIIRPDLYCPLDPQSHCAELHVHLDPFGLPVEDRAGS